MKKILTSLALLGAACALTFAAGPLKAPSGGKQISTELLGIFFEDISSAADGGLCAELVQNGSFEYGPADRDGWGPGTAWQTVRPGYSLGYIEVRQQDPVHPLNPNYMRMHIERVGHYYDYDGWTGVGILNRGFDGIPVKAGEKYDFSVFLRNPDGCGKDIRIALTEPGPSGILAEASFRASGSGWKKYECTLTASADCPAAELRLLALTAGDIDIDMVSLYPRDTYMGHGLRKDLVQALADLNPKFMRFPGGCIVHGGVDGFWGTYRWKTTVGPREQRRALKNAWGYKQSMELGYYEYFQLCEDLGMEPVPILPCGVSCQGAGGGWIIRTQTQDAVPMGEMDEWVQDALDLIEWANGPADSEWGRVRAEAGHPEPFGLKYLGLGNEEKITPEFEERFKYIYDRVRAAHPEIVIIGTVGPGSHPGNYDYDEGWRFGEELGIPILDEHYYEPREYFLTSRQYDGYPRDRATKVYLGEYASKDKKFADALAEALYLLHVERNADVVVMSSYAPLFSRRGASNWEPDLIYFDNERVYPSCSYYVQQLFGQSSGDYWYGDCVSFDREDALLGASAVLNTQERKLFVKICNAGPGAATAKLDLSRFKAFRSVTRTVLKGNPDDENNYESQPVAPVRETVQLKKKASVDAAPYSVTMYTISF